MNLLRAPLLAVVVVVVVLALWAAGPAQGAGFVDVLDTPSLISPLASKSLLQSVVRAGDRIVVVGQRGHIVISSDGGATWKQSPVPVSSDLTSVYFVDDKQGWVAGHDGVILHTGDGGEKWMCSSTVSRRTICWSQRWSAKSLPSRLRKRRRSFSPKPSAT